MTNYKMILQYEGARYDGWQKQGNTDNTIQGKLEQILTRMAGEPVEVSGSGRTDAGVHALAQVANFHLKTKEPQEALQAYLNRYLPDDIRVLALEEAAPRFHSRLNARDKTYIYRIETGDKKDVFARRQLFGLGRTLDVERMRRAAGLLTGEHDFFGYSSGKKTKKSTVRTIYELRVETMGSEVRLVVRGNGFLYNMVRILAGTLIEVGLGERDPESVLDPIRKKDRSLAGMTAPAEGLALAEVRY